MSQAEKSVKPQRGLLTLLFVFVMPFAPLLYLYQKNSSYMFLRQALLAAAIGGLLCVAVFALGKKVFRSTMSGVLIALLLLLGVFAATPLVALANAIGQWLHTGKYVGYGVVALAVALLFAGVGLLGKKLPSELVNAFYMLVGVLLLFNLVPTVGIVARSVDSGRPQTTFAVDQSVANDDAPNVYWLFADDMTSLETLEKIAGSGYDATALQTMLTDRGFAITPNATLNTDWYTMVATGALFSPGYYDSALLPLAGQRGAMREYVTANWSDVVLANRQNELLAAFKAKGYTPVQLALNLHRFFFAQGDPYYAIADHFFNPFNTPEYRYDKPYRVVKDVTSAERDSARSLALLIAGEVGTKLYDLMDPEEHQVREPLTHTLPQRELERILLCDEQSALNDKAKMLDDYSAVVNSLYDGLMTVKSSKITVMHLMLAHYPWRFTLEDSLRSDNLYSLDNYLPQYEISMRIYMNLVDLILQHDPNAIIVLQSDHGIGYSKLDESQFSPEYYTELRNSVMQAIRVPEKWNAPYDVLTDARNISRWLVNTFVGPNYEYIAP